MRFVFNIAILLTTFFYVSSIKSQNELNFAEFSYLIKPGFSENNKQLQLAAIFDSIVYGQYPEALTSIHELKSKTPKSDLFYSALLCYEANIYYNKSKYKQSIDLCDSVILFSNKHEFNGYYLKALNAKAKAQAALNLLIDAKTN